MSESFINNFKNKNIGIVLSSSFFGFYGHAGFVAALEELGIDPNCYGGTSAGALIASLCASGKTSVEIENVLSNITRNDFWDPDYLHLTAKLFRFLKGWEGLLKGKLFQNLLESEFGEIPVNETKHPCCIVATDITKKRKKIFSSESMAKAVYASGTVPGLFKPLRINNSTMYDGGLLCKAPVYDLYESQKPEIIIVHYIKSKGLKEEDNPLNSLFSPIKVTETISTINRHLSYTYEKKLVEMSGCKIIEVVTQPPRVSPFKLQSGKDAFAASKQQTLDYIRSI